MTTRALVVGCDAYPRLPGADLTGAVADSLEFREWLLRGGGVRPDNLRFLASCSPSGTAVPGAVQVDGSADTKSFADEVRRLVTELSADRLYVYFAGYGCPTDRVAYLARDAIALTDVDPANPALDCVVVNELTAQLAQGDFGVIVTILDARAKVPIRGPFQGIGFGSRWRGRRVSGAALQFLVMPATDLSLQDEKACPSTVLIPKGDGAGPSGGRGALTAALLAGLAGAAAVAVVGDAVVGDAVVGDAVVGVAVVGDAVVGDAVVGDAVVGDAVAGDSVVDDAVVDDAGTGRSREVRWSALERYLHGALPRRPPRTCGQDPSLVLATVPAAQHSTGWTPAVGSARADRPAPDIRAVGADTEFGEFEVRSADAHAMVTIEDASGVRQAVGVGSIVGLLPVGSYTAVLSDPVGVDPRVRLEVTPGQLSEVRVDRPDRRDGLGLIDDDSLRWSSAAAQLAVATREFWSVGHRSFLVMGGTAQVARMRSPERQLIAGADPLELGGYGQGELALPEGAGWWIAVPVSKPWCTVPIGGHRVTVPVAPDSVTAVAVTAAAITVALFDNTHADPEQIAKQDRVQEYIAAGQLGAADLTSRGPVARQHRWPWGASATVRRLIDEKRPLLSVENAERVDGSAGDGSSGPAENTHQPPGGDPLHRFAVHVLPDRRHLLVGRGPWAVWLDW